MNKDTTNAACRALKALDNFLACALVDTEAVAGTNDVPQTAQHFAEFRRTVGDITRQVAALEGHVRTLSYELLPTMMTNQDIKSIHVLGLGTVTVNVRWTATMPDKEVGMKWLRATGNEGLIIETVNAPTLTVFAKDMALNGMPLPSDIFKVGTAQHISITKE